MKCWRIKCVQWDLWHRLTIWRNIHRENWSLHAKCYCWSRPVNHPETGTNRSRRRKEVRQRPTCQCVCQFFESSESIIPGVRTPLIHNNGFWVEGFVWIVRIRNQLVWLHWLWNQARDFQASDPSVQLWPRCANTPMRPWFVSCKHRRPFRSRWTFRRIFPGRVCLQVHCIKKDAKLVYQIFFRRKKFVKLCFYIQVKFFHNSFVFLDFLWNIKVVHFWYHSSKLRKNSWNFQSKCAEFIHFYDFFISNM